ncbi:SGNH/GDSL hydrolase family protein [Acinetobacter sp. ANC 5414]|uniref:SGNH/GDSL hydrolase family protein n=1 Tax=Acinetobacter sp. ANC 5414 TaxID=2731251 RepID=UPI0014904BD5|nr:SGNH/GDSL hydrolase family protein [Acinetobacter sp. ANC 5414]NNH00126.1 SGNH/GDSL hydrolase family protein [Acinetobacter sp. ANC 5414]
MKYVALGDCNTQGDPNNFGNAYPERFAKEMRWMVTNFGHTMSTTREGLEYFKRPETQNADIISIQFGIVDSWVTFKGAPFVLYYPDNKWRKFLRKIVKKIKKYGRKLKFHSLFGTRNVVEVGEYLRNIQYIIENSKARVIYLVEIYPNLDLSREPNILRYNQALKSMCDNKRVFFVPVFDLLKPNPHGENFDDTTHLSSIGHDIVKDQLLAVTNNSDIRSIL